VPWRNATPACCPLRLTPALVRTRRRKPIHLEGAYNSLLAEWPSEVSGTGKSMAETLLPRSDRGAQGPQGPEVEPAFCVPRALHPHRQEPGAGKFRAQRRWKVTRG